MHWIVQVMSFLGQTFFIARDTHAKATRDRNSEKTKGMADQNN
jgi:hypothetical protein